MQLWKHLKYGIQLGSIFFLRNHVLRIKEAKDLIAFRKNACVDLYFPIILDDFTNFHKKCFSDYNLEVNQPETRKPQNQEMQDTDDSQVRQIMIFRPFLLIC